LATLAITVILGTKAIVAYITPMMHTVIYTRIWMPCMFRLGVSQVIPGLVNVYVDTADMYKSTHIHARALFGCSN
jgi:hypothetical protein